MDKFVARQKDRAADNAGPTDAAKKRKVSDEGRIVQDSWEIDYFISELKGKPFCLICKQTLAVKKKYNVQRHYETRHPAHIEPSHQGQLSELAFYRNSKTV